MKRASPNHPNGRIVESGLVYWYSYSTCLPPGAALGAVRTFKMTPTGRDLCRAPSDTRSTRRHFSRVVRAPRHPQSSFECAPRLEMRMRAQRTVPLAKWANLLSPTARAERLRSKWGVGTRNDNRASAASGQLRERERVCCVP